MDEVGKAAKTLQDSIYNKKVKEINEKWNSQISDAQKEADKYSKELEQSRKDFDSMNKELESKIKTVEVLTDKTNTLSKDIAQLGTDIEKVKTRQGSILQNPNIYSDKVAALKEQKNQALQKSQEEAQKMVQQQLAGIPSARLRNRITDCP